jgi:peptidoglycan hydrolase-like protein with peptidoglycan-binding domain
VSGGADGIFGAGTEQAVRSFQESIGLRPTGIVTAKTAAALGVTP